MLNDDDILGPNTKDTVRPQGGIKPHPGMKYKGSVGPLEETMRKIAQEDMPEKTQQPVGEVMGGVTVFWLAKAFGMEVTTVRKRLADCPHLMRKTSGFLYSIPVAAQYLVRPRLDIKNYLAQLKPHELPQQLQGSYWDANLKRQKFEQIMGELWETEDVMSVFAEVFKTIKFSIQLWPDALERKSGLSDSDRAVLVKMGDALQDEIYQGIVKMAQDKNTPNALQRFEQALAAQQPEDLPEFEDDEEDIL